MLLPTLLCAGYTQAKKTQIIEFHQSTRNLIMKCIYLHSFFLSIPYLEYNVKLTIINEIKPKKPVTCEPENLEINNLDRRTDGQQRKSSFKCSIFIFWSKTERNRNRKRNLKKYSFTSSFFAYLYQR